MGREELLQLIPIKGLGLQLEKVDEELRKVASGSVFQPTINQLIGAGGKRLRPMLTLACAELAGQKINQSTLLAATSVELIHQASLVHDDIIDQDNPRLADNALLVGDYLLSAGLGLSAKAGQKSAAILSAAVRQMAEGQALQLTNRFSFDAADDFYIRVNKAKTGALFSAASRLGLADNEQANVFGRYGQVFGVAFQIIDDISDDDFEIPGVKAAKQAVRQYAKQAGQQLEVLADSPLRQSLMDLPDIYLQFALI